MKDSSRKINEKLDGRVAVCKMKISIYKDWAAQVSALLEMEPMVYKEKDTIRLYKITRDQAKRLEHEHIPFVIVHH